MFDNLSKNKKYTNFVVFMISLVIVIILSATIAVFTSSATAKADSATTIETTVSTVKYYVKEYNGNICVFDDLSKLPITYTNTPVSRFPSQDQELLLKGIEAHNEKELKRILEDYCS